MKKFIIGVLVGISITAAGSAYADDIVQSVVGKSVDGQLPVKISGKELSTQAIVVEGTSYLPVRAVGESLNMEVKYDPATGIELKGAKAMTETVPFDKEALRARLERNNKVMELRNKQRAIIDEIPQYSNIVTSADHKKFTVEGFEYNDEYYEAKRIWEEKKAEIASIEEQIKAIQNP
jgi:hypothetical protein